MLGKLGGDTGSLDFYCIDIPEMKKGHKYVTIVCLFAH